jgi:hypothetical protein
MKKAKKRVGRPPKPPAEGKRISLGLKVTAAVKRRIDKAAQDSGRTQSQEAEALIERAFLYDGMLQAIRTTLANISKGRIDAAFREAGFTAIHTPYGKVWVPRDFPIKASGFLGDDGGKKEI